jgi:hypothetical protein
MHHKGTESTKDRMAEKQSSMTGGRAGSPRRPLCDYIPAEVKCLVHRLAYNSEVVRQAPAAAQRVWPSARPVSCRRCLGDHLRWDHDR